MQHKEASQDNTAASSRRKLLGDTAQIVSSASLAMLGAAVLPAPGAFAEEIYRSDVSTYDTSKLADEWEGFLPERKVTRGGKNIVITQEFGNKKKNGLAVYEGNLILTAYMEGLGKDYWSGARVLELGCGTGLGSITASAMGAASVTASDREDTVLALAEKNMQANIKDRASFRTAKVSWGSDVCAADAPKYKREIGGCWDASSKAPLVGRGKDGNDAYDVIIGADLTYTSGLIELLAKTLKDFSGPNTEILLCWCEPTLFTFNTDVMTELNEKGIPLLEKDFAVERITKGPAFDAGLSNKSRSFILRMKRK